jgi:two-component system LytT family sensor kinase
MVGVISFQNQRRQLNFLKISELKNRTILYHSVFWASIYLLWVAVFRSYSIALTKTMTIEFCYLLFITVDYYIINNFIVPQFLLKKKYALFLLSTILIIALSAWFRALVATEFNLHFFKPSVYFDFDTLYINSILNITIWVLIITMGKMLIDRVQTQQLVELLEKERVKNELNFLKAQINPHALFNSLNTIYGQIDKSNQVARNILLQFSELLRYQLYDCAEEKISLDREIGYIKNYVAFHRLRKDESLVVTLQTEPIEADLTIAPLLLVVLIENAFKFVSSFADKENKITINIHTKNSILHSSFVNTKEVRQVDVSSNANGIGIANLKRRLELLYPNKYELNKRDENAQYETTLRIDLS